MKKLLLLFLAMAGMVSSANAAKLYIDINSNDYSIVNVYAWKDDVNNGPGVTVEETTVNAFGTSWYVFEMGEFENALIKNDAAWTDGHIQTNNIYNITEDTYITVNGATATKVNWHYPRFLNSISEDGWNVENNNLISTTEDALTYSKTFSKDDIGNQEQFYFRFRAGYDNYYPQLYPQVSDGQNEELSIGTTTSTYYQDGNNNGIANNDNNNRSWKVLIPSDYSSIKLTAAYRKVEGEWKWQISADAYISKTVSGTNEYATFGTTVPVDLSGISSKGVTAYTVTANANNGQISKTPKSDALAANEGVLLRNTTGSDVMLSIPVAASASASISNDMIAFTGTGNLTQPTSGNETYYILAKENDTDGVGFYKVNTESGNDMGTNTAYLKVTGANARSFLWFGETTGIEQVESTILNGEAYNLAGQRVAQPTKGLYIVNGKKVIMK